MLLAMEKPPREAGSLRAWLAKVVRSRALLELRSSRRRNRRERLTARPELIPDADDVVEQLEVQQQVTAAVLRLSESQRQVITLHYYHELPAVEIASRLGVPASTVRSRLARAIAAIRADLDREFGDRRAWSLPLASLTLSQSASATATATLIATISGGVIMKKLFAALAIAAAILLSYQLIPDQTPVDPPTKNSAALPAPPVTDIDSKDRSSPNTEAAPVAPASKPKLSAETTSSEDTEEFPTSIVNGRIWRTDGQSMEGARVGLWQEPLAGPSPVDADGNFHIKTIGNGTTSFYVDVDGVRVGIDRKIRPNPDSETFVELELDLAHVFDLRILERRTGLPIPSVKVSLIRESEGEQASISYARSDDDGELTMRYLPSGPYRLSVSDDRYQFLETRIDVPAHAVKTLHLDDRRELTIRLNGYADHEPQSGIRVWLIR